MVLNCRWGIYDGHTETVATHTLHSVRTTTSRISQDE